MNPSKILAASLLLGVMTGCAATTEETGANEGAASSSAAKLKDYSMLQLIVGMDAKTGDADRDRDFESRESPKMMAAIKANGGKQTGEYSWVSGYLGAEIGLTGDDAKMPIGLECSDTTENPSEHFKAVSCTMFVVVKTADVTKIDESTLQAKVNGKLAAAIAAGLPLDPTRPSVGATYTKSGRNSCARIVVPNAPTDCTVGGLGGAINLEDVANGVSSDGPPMTAAQKAEAKKNVQKLIAAFF